MTAMNTTTSANTMNAQDVIQSDLQTIRETLTDELNTMAGQSLLIIGGAGFLGYYLVQTIVDHNRVSSPDKQIPLTVYDNFIRGVPSWLEDLGKEGGLTLKKHDVIAPLPEDMPAFDYIIHAASIASPMYYRKYPIETMDANVNGLRRVLDYAVERKNNSDPVKGLLYYSTSEIYGDPAPEDIPTPETYRGNVSCTGPRACYDESKRYGETLCVNFAQQHGIHVTIARPFNNYGPGLKITDKRVLPDFVRDTLNGKDIVMLSDGSPTRTFCYITDAIAGYYKVLVKGQPGESYNIGTESPEISMRELSDRVVANAAELWDYTGKVVFEKSEDAEYLTDNPNRRCPIIAKAREELGYEPKVGVEEGLKRAMIWYRDNATAEEA